MTIEQLLLHREVEAFLFAEAALIDDRRFDEWLELLADDFRIHVPITRNIRYDQASEEKTRERRDISWIDEGKATIAQRVAQIATGLHWAEEPRSRTVHLITNVRLSEVKSGTGGVEEVTATSAFMLYRNRASNETDYMAGRRTDVLLRSAATWKVRRREVDLAQTVLLAKNLTTFF